MSISWPFFLPPQFLPPFSYLHRFKSHLPPMTQLQTLFLQSYADQSSHPTVTWTFAESQISLTTKVKGRSKRRPPRATHSSRQTSAIDHRICLPSQKVTTRSQATQKARHSLPNKRKRVFIKCPITLSPFHLLYDHQCPLLFLLLALCPHAATT